MELKPWRLYFDDSRHKNGIGIGILMISPNKISTKFKYRINGSFSNNKVEYEVLIVRLKFLLDLGGKESN